MAALPEGVPPEAADGQPLLSEEVPAAAASAPAASAPAAAADALTLEVEAGGDEQAEAAAERPAPAEQEQAEGAPEKPAAAAAEQPANQEQEQAPEPPAPADPFADIAPEQARNAEGRAQLADIAAGIAPAEADRALEEDAFQRLVVLVEACLASALEDVDASRMAAFVDVVDTYTLAGQERRLSTEPSILEAPIWANEPFWTAAVPAMADTARAAVPAAAAPDAAGSPRPEAAARARDAALADAAFQTLYTAVDHMLKFGGVSVPTVDKFIEYALPLPPLFPPKATGAPAARGGSALSSLQLTSLFRALAGA